MLQSRGFSVLGIDLSPVMLGFARRRFAAICDVMFCKADIRDAGSRTQTAGSIGN
jgi:hypothetical protein